MADTLRSEPISTKLQRIAEQAARYPDMTFTTLAHHMDVALLRQAYLRTRKNGAPGIDQITAVEYAKNLEENLLNLYERLRTGKYVAPPVKRVYIDKADGSKRPIGIPTFEDKIVQRSVVMLLEPVYEQTFYDFSYGFRPGFSPHLAVQDLRERCMNEGINWIVDADVLKFFDSMDHELLREFVRRRVKDGAIMRMIGKWLNAGIMEEGERRSVDTGSPQGGVVSPLLSNIFLHYVLDEWFAQEVKPRLRGRCFIVRFADDFVIGCQRKEDADRVMEVLPKRFGRFKLLIHPEKTKLVEFVKPKPEHPSGKGFGTFDFLGFTFYWSKSRKGNWVIKKKTARKRSHRFTVGIWNWLKVNRHKRLSEQQRTLAQKLRGHYQYFGVRCNMRALQIVYYRTLKSWRHWLSRRCHKGYVRWDKFLLTLQKYPIPRPRIIHSI